MTQLIAIDPLRLESIDVLKSGGHDSAADGLCVMVRGSAAIGARR